MLSPPVTAWRNSPLARVAVSVGLTSSACGAVMPLRQVVQAVTLTTRGAWAAGAPPAAARPTAAARAMLAAATLKESRGTTSAVAAPHALRGCRPAALRRHDRHEPDDHLVHLRLRRGARRLAAADATGAPLVLAGGTRELSV